MMTDACCHQDGQVMERIDPDQDRIKNSKNIINSLIIRLIINPGSIQDRIFIISVRLKPPTKAGTAVNSDLKSGYF